MTMKEFRYFTIFQHKEEQAYLRDMHNHGWAFTHVTGLGMYHFTECEPADVIYQLDYNQEGREHRAEYVQMFADCGWEYLQDFFGYSYFRKSAADSNGDEEIFCDDESRMEMMQRVLKDRALPLFVIFSAVLIPQFFLQWGQGQYVLCVFIGGMILAYLLLLGGFAGKYWAYRNRYKK